MPAYRPEYRQSWAIVVGINAYAHLPPLRYAVNDARLLAETLHTVCGFPSENTLLLEDAAATRDAILTTFRRTLTNPRERRAEPDDRVLFFFAGHGLTRTKFDGQQSGYLALAEAGADEWEACLGMDELLDEADYTPAKHTLFLLDACFSGLALSRGANTNRLAADLLTRRAVQAFTAGTADQRVSDGRGKNSPFTLHLVDGLRGNATTPDGLLTASQLFQYVRDRVVSEPGSIQTPYFGNLHGDGDMVFALPQPPQLRPELRVLLDSDQPRYRLLALDDVRQALKNAERPLAELIRAELIRLGETDPAPSVRAMAQGILEEGEHQLQIRETARRIEAAQLAARIKAKEEEIERRRREELALQLTPDLVLKLARVPPGEFRLGSDPDQDPALYDEELPQLKLMLPAYLMGKAPVTVAQFSAFVDSTGYKTTAEREGSSWTYRGGKWGEVKGADWRHPRGPDSDVTQKGDHPVTVVSWDDAVAFCVWASVVTERAVHLPSEAEWEKAARGGDARLYPWGNEPPDERQCNFSMRVGDTTPVGHYSPHGDSPYGCVDMAGNVWEWTASLWRPYPYRFDENREEIPNRNARVVRGGSFHGNFRRLRCAFRRPRSPHNRLVNYGFRVCARPLV